MALFTDSEVVTLDDLLQFEGSLVQVSSTHGIDVQAKIRLATDEIGDKLMLNLLRTGQSDPQWLNRVKIGLSTVVVTPIQARIIFETCGGSSLKRAQIAADLSWRSLHAAEQARERVPQNEHMFKVAVVCAMEAHMSP
jgi:hypothetical protein